MIRNTNVRNGFRAAITVVLIGAPGSACGGPNPGTARTTPSPVAVQNSSPGTSPSLSPASSPSTSPSSAPTPLSAFPQCRLPYYKGGTGGFIGGASGSWTADPSGHITPNPAWALVPGDSYDWALGIWVPVGARYQSA